MSPTKTPKRPLSKKVVNLNHELARRRGVRNLKKRFLIVCEDEKSAPNYFRSLKKHFNLSAASIEVVGGGGHSQPIEVVKKAVELKNRAKDRHSGTEPFEHIWCVIDGDYGVKIHDARAKVKANHIELAISTKCFECWVLLHFEESDTSTSDCDALVYSLNRAMEKKSLSPYQKGKCDFKTIVLDVRNACKRAEKLRKPGLARNELPENQNPCTEIYRLINAILTQEDKEVGKSTRNK